jgi:spoIIIJ-associated protein
MSEQHDTVVDDGPANSDLAPRDEATAVERDDSATVERGTEERPEERPEEQGAEEQRAEEPPVDEPDTAEEGFAPRRPVKVADLEREGEVAADFLETLLDIADLDGDIDVDVDGDRAAVSIVDSDEGRVPRRLVGTNGSVLEALQELTRLAVQSATGERSRLMLDVAGHRAERRAALISIARQAIEGVKESGQQQALEPMSAFERKVVHDEVLAAGLVSESDGVEPRRFVVVHPAS